MRLVVDASAAMSWALEDERDDLARAMARSVLRHGAFVPPHFAAEIDNILLVAVRRKRTTMARCVEIAAAMARLPLRVETTGVELGSQNVLEAAVKHHLSAYDAAYVVLARELGARLMTRDKQMRAVAAGLRLEWSQATS